MTMKTDTLTSLYSDFEEILINKSHKLFTTPRNSLVVQKPCQQTSNFPAATKFQARVN
jgi:hypothetical protein